MNRKEFMSRLSQLLDGVSKEEKEEALTYYENYFEDAGPENEQNIIRELESPEKVAEIIRRDLGITDLVISTPEDGEGEEGKQDGRQQNQGQWNGQQSQTGQYNSKSQNTDSSQKDTIIIVLLVALLVVTSPLWIGFVAGVFGTIIGIFAGLFGISVGGILGGIAMLAVSIGLMVAGRIALGLLSLGVGLLFFTMGILAVVLLVLLCGMFIPWLCRQIKKLWNKMFGKKGVKA
ncbi:MAG: DUF1700 domain-containing protein [Lachnospiraceae bacterium]|nr:DUF1700 domain-containing protein [Lachnospiraceae bacterium]